MKLYELHPVYKNGVLWMDCPCRLISNHKSADPTAPASIRIRILTDDAKEVFTLPKYAFAGIFPETFSLHPAITSSCGKKFYIQNGDVIDSVV
jgi:hypothetical protein